MNKHIMLIHGAWMTPSCWDGFRAFYAGKGIECSAPAWPFVDRPVEALRNNPDPNFAKVTIRQLVDHFAELVEQHPEPPILVGHSFGGLIVQMLLDRGLGAAGVAIDAGPPRGVLPSPVAIKSALPVLLTWGGWRRVLSMSFESFASTFANTIPPAEQRKAFDAQVVPAPGRIYFQAALGIGNSVNFSNARRAPLLLVAGEEDKTSTPSMVKAMLRKYSRSPVRVDMLTFPGRSHWLIAEAGWQEVAERTLAWAISTAR